ncbi:MAG: cytidine deaminase [Bacteroidetes bacterium]|nr:cytidine deaminase [Bacteroidota bacterium]
MKLITHETKIAVYQAEEIPEEYLQLIEEAKNQTKKSYAPYSTFCVGAAVLLETGVIVKGNNQENSAYPSGLCAERVAMFYANSQYPDVAPTVVVIAAFTGGEFLSEPITPCGACRQVLLETEQRYDKPIKIILYGTEKTFILDNVRQLLPLCFEKSSLKLDTEKMST